MLGGVQQDAIRLEFTEEGVEVLVVFLGGAGKDKDVVQIGETEIQVFEYLVHETLESLGSVLQAKGHVRKFEKAERCGDNCLLDVIRVDRNLMVSPHKVNFGKDGAAEKAVGVILYVWDLVPVRYSAGVECLVVSTRPPTAVLGHEMEGGQPWSLIMPGCTVLQHGVELGLGCGQAVRGKTARVAAGGSPFVGGSLSARGVSSAGRSRVGCIFRLGPRNSNGNSRCHGVQKGGRGCCNSGSWSMSGCGFVVPAARQLDV